MADIKVTIKQAREILAAERIDSAVANNVLRELENATSSASPWWVIALKTLAYLIGLLLAGYGTSAAAMTIF